MMRCKDRMSMEVEPERCMYCNREVDPDDPWTRSLNHGLDFAHRACMEQALRNGTAVEISPAYDRFRTLSATRRDPHDPDGGEDELRCPNRGRLVGW